MAHVRITKIRGTRFMKFNRLLPLTAAVVAVSLLPALAANDAKAAGETAKKCFFVSSYHRGYEHADQEEAGLRAALAGHCTIRQFDMDSKRHGEQAFKENAALKAKAIIESWKPDIVIVADDNAVKYLLRPYYKDAKIPFVFCGLNWTAAEYGLPYKNATGMIEVAPITQLLRNAERMLPQFHRAFYLGADVLTEKKNLKRYQEAAKQMGFTVDYALVDSTDAWIKEYKRAQQYDLVILGVRNGIEHWDHDKVVAAILKNTRKLSVTIHDWMMPYTILGMTKVSREQGEWAGLTAIRILGGAKPGDIPVVPNRQRDVWINSKILAVSGVHLPQELMRKGKKIAEVAR